MTLEKIKSDFKEYLESKKVLRECVETYNINNENESNIIVSYVITCLNWIEPLFEKQFGYDLVDELIGNQNMSLRVFLKKEIRK